MSTDIEGRLEALRREVQELKSKGEIVVSEKLANPAPLGLAGFGITTLVLNVINAEIISEESIGMVLPLGLFYGGLAQFMAGMWEAKKNNTFGFTAFSSYGAFWMAYALMKILVGNGVLNPVPHEGMTVFLVAWGIFSTYMFIGTIKISVALQAAFAGVAVLFFLLAWGQHNETVHKIAGYEGLFTAGAALYASAAQVINEAWGRYVLPLGIVKK
jgi:uncharacterized protein